MIKKGSRSERELFHLLWKHFGPCVRSAGSGSTTKPSPDLLASNGSRTLAIECKSTKAKKLYIPLKEIDELLLFSSSFNAEAWLAVRFDNKGWYFIQAKNLTKSKGDSFSISYSELLKNGLVFNEFVGKYRQERL